MQTICLTTLAAYIVHAKARYNGLRNNYKFRTYILLLFFKKCVWCVIVIILLFSDFLLIIYFFFVLPFMEVNKIAVNFNERLNSGISINSISLIEILHNYKIKYVNIYFFIFNALR